MVDLPTFHDLSPEQIQLLLDAYRPFPGATQEQTVNAFLAWHANNIHTFVRARARAQIEESYKAQLTAAEAAIAAILPVIPPPQPPAAPDPDPPIGP